MSNTFSPKPMVVDGNIFLNAIKSSILNSQDPTDFLFNYKSADNIYYRGRGVLISTFLNSLFSMTSEISKRGYSPTHLVVVWDKKENGKYKKTEILDALNDGSTYKSDRTFVKKEDLNNPDLTDKERTKIEAELKISKEFLEARNFLMSNLPKIGIPSVMYSGWEADDIDYLWGLETNRRGGVHIHISNDGDWKFHLTGDDILFQKIIGKTYVNTKESVREKFKIPTNLTILEWAARFYSAKGTHNNLLRTIDPEIKMFTKKYKDRLFSDTEDTGFITLKSRYDAQKKTFDIESFEGSKDIINDYNKYIIEKDGTSFDIDKFTSLLKTIGISSESRSYSNLIKGYKKLKSDLSEGIISQI